MNSKLAVMEHQTIILLFTVVFLTGLCGSVAAQSGSNYIIVDTGQQKCYNNSSEIASPQPGQSFYGQDAQFNVNQPHYLDNGDGTITDLVTGLMWQKAVGAKMSFGEALAGADTFSLAGYDDWRLPSIKELYSLILFSGIDPSGWNGTNADLLTPFIDTNYFEFEYGDVSSGERIIDAQYASATKYVGTTMMGAETMFGVNFADGRIKGYPTGPMPGQTEGKKFFVKYVRGNPDYGVNKFQDNGDGTVTDLATGLSWQRNDSQTALSWEEALSLVQQKNSENYLGYSDWRLPNAKELQSIVDYSRSPSTTQSAAINPIFNCSTITDEGGETNYPFYWTSSTHTNMMNGMNAVYVCFGEALGWMRDPLGNYQLLDVHGAGAQRSDPKQGDPANWPYGHGPQGDVIRIYNYVRLVRGGEVTTGAGEDYWDSASAPKSFALDQNYPNPFNPTTTIRFSLAQKARVTLCVFDVVGKKVTKLLDESLNAGEHAVNFNATGLPSGFYFYSLTAGQLTQARKATLLK